MSASALLARTNDAIAELHEIRCADPAAQGAIDTVRLTIHTLEQWWLPELNRTVARSIR